MDRNEEEYKPVDNSKDEYEDTEDLGTYETHQSGAEPIVDKPTIDNFFNTEQLLQEIEKPFKGFQKVNGEWVYKNNPIARTKFINSTMNSIRSVINQQNMISNLSEDEIKFMLLEKIKGFIFALYDEPSVEDEDVENLINIVDHALEVFAGQIKGGFGARTLRQISAAVSYETPDKVKDDSIFSFGVGNTNLLKIGGSNK